ncbi:pentapeptide repeat-containing protein [Mariluticola halotolerans]|uniref:pentapeptide repeat-containing protein n=1 Tax=Mariluticola halotolerans TaxID=2909283 RepID=UPI0026E21D25|nr:pentapeptide repeat-containing protein [Mariluticola halotolerans]UJQ95520.1 pentapeptide repeat-containing protein [Mariluticola halotolerans]
MQNDRWNLLEWLCISPRVFKSKSVGALVSFSIIMATLLFVPATFFRFAMVLLGSEQFQSATERYEAIRNMGLVIAALVGVPFLVWRSIVAQKQVDIAEQGNITDRINKAIEGLGAEKTIKQVVETPRYQRHNDEWLRDEAGKLLPALRPDGLEIVDRETFESSQPNLEVRIGSIYALERIAQDSPRDHIQIMEILCAYVRENAPALSLEPTEELSKRPRPRSDIQTVITVIARRSVDQIKIETQRKFRLDFRNADFSGVDFRKGNFAAAQFHRCRIEAADFSNCDLMGTQFFGALLNHSGFSQSNLFGTRFDSAIINRPIIPVGAMSESITMGEIYGISLAAADISEINYLGEAEKANLTFGTKDTKLHPDLDFPRKIYAGELHRIRKLENSNKLEEADEARAQLYTNSFVDWCPHDRSDLSSNYYYRNFLDRLNIQGWPFSD